MSAAHCCDDTGSRVGTAPGVAAVLPPGPGLAQPSSREASRRRARWPDRMAFPRGQGGPVDQCPGPIANRAAGVVKAVCHGSYGKIAGFRPARPRHPSSFMQLIPESRSEEHTSELQSLMRISYAVFCLKKKKKNTI